MSERIKKELDDLLKQGVENWGAWITFQKSETPPNKNIVERLRLQHDYQSWYSIALPLIAQLLPDRVSEFSEQYRLAGKAPNSLNATNYTISDYLGGIHVSAAGIPSFDHDSVFLIRFDRQLAILKSARIRLESLLADIQGVLQAELFDDTIVAAEELLKAGHLRASGTLVSCV